MGLYGRTIKKAILKTTRLHSATPSLGADELHCIILNLIGALARESGIGYSSGSSAIFPSTLLRPVLSDPAFLEYRLQDGQFHDGTHYYTLLCSGDYSVNKRPTAQTALTLPGHRIISSSLGVHSGMIITARPTHRGLEIRTIIQVSGKDIEVNFRSIHLASIAVERSQSCSHEPRVSLDTILTKRVVPTSVEAPLHSGKRISMPLTYCSPEAQFLCCVMGVRTLLQSNCCLNCAVKEAIDGAFSMVIQS